MIWPGSLKAQEMSIKELHRQMEHNQTTMQYLYETQRSSEASVRKVLYNTRASAKQRFPRKESGVKDPGPPSMLRRRSSIQMADFPRTDSQFSQDFGSQLRGNLAQMGKITLTEVKFAEKPWENDNFVPSANPFALPVGHRNERWGQGLVQPVTVAQFEQFRDHFEHYQAPCKPLGLVLGPSGWKVNEPYHQPQLAVDRPLPSLTPDLRQRLQAAEADCRMNQLLKYQADSKYDEELRKA